MRRTSGVMLVLALVLAGASVAATTGAAAAPTLDPGVTDKSVTIGFISSQTGPAGSTFKRAIPGFKARIARQNAEGGVNGLKIKTEIIDDQTLQNQQAVQDLVQNRHVFVVVNDSPTANFSYRYLLQNRVPTIGGGFDGQYYYDPGNTSLIPVVLNPPDGLTYDMATRVMKKLGARKIATLAYGSSPSSGANAQALQQYAAPNVGLKGVYTNINVDFGTSDVTPLVLSIKNSGADAVYLPMVAATNFAVVQGLAQNGVTMKANILATGYGQDLLDQPVAQTLNSRTLLLQTFEPVELKTKATKQFQADLKKYVHYTGVPDFGMYTGYISADLTIRGLEHAGTPPTRQAFVDGARNSGPYDQAGLACQAVNYTATAAGKFPPRGCAYFIQVKNGKFVVYNHGKPVVGQLVGKPDLKAKALSSQ
jgi:ABC-type branched-subunit amino acid transport system substrate-binding protein